MVTMIQASLLRGLAPKHPSRVRSKPRSKNVDFYLKRSADKIKAGVGAQMGGFGGFASGSYTEQTPHDSNIVEGEFTEVEDNPPVISPTDKK